MCPSALSPPGTLGSTMPLLLVTTDQGKEHTAIEEIPDCLYRYDQEVKVEPTQFRGVLKVVTSMPAREAARIIRSCWTSHVRQVIPVDVVVPADMDSIVRGALELARGASGTIAVRCARRGGKVESSKRVEEVVGAALVERLGLKVSLRDPDHLLRVEVVGDEAYLSLLSREDLKPVERRWPPRTA